MGVIGDLRQYLGFRHRHHQVAAAIAHIQQFVDVLPLFIEHILADDADIGCTVFHIGGQVHRLHDDELHLGLFIGDDQLPGIFHHVFRRITDLGKEFHRFCKTFSLGQGNCQIIHSVFSPILHMLRLRTGWPHRL